MGSRPGHDRQIGARFGGLQIGPRRALSLPVGDGQLIAAKPLLIEPVEILAQPVPRLSPGLKAGLVQRMIGPFSPGHRQRTACAMKRIGAIDKVFRAFEIGQHLRKRPPVQPHLPPLVIIAWMPPHIDHAVDRRRPTQPLATRLPQAPSVHMRLGLGPETPVVHRFLLDQRAHPGRHPHQHRRVWPAGFQHQHFHLRVFAQPRRQHRTCAACADDDIVELAGGHCGPLHAY